MAMKMLNMRKAILLYEIIDPYLPDGIDEDMTGMELLELVIKKDAEDGTDGYARALMLMTGHSDEELAEFSPEYNMQMFVEGFGINRVFDLRRFCESL